MIQDIRKFFGGGGSVSTKPKEPANKPPVQNKKREPSKERKKGPSPKPAEKKKPETSQKAKKSSKKVIDSDSEEVEIIDSSDDGDFTTLKAKNGNRKHSAGTDKNGNKKPVKEICPSPEGSKDTKKRKSSSKVIIIFNSI